MAGLIKTQFTKVKTNPVGAIAGGVLSFWALGKYGKVRNMYAKVGLSIVGAVAAAHAHSYVRSKIALNKSKPKK